MSFYWQFFMSVKSVSVYFVKNKIGKKRTVKHSCMLVYFASVTTSVDKISFGYAEDLGRNSMHTNYF